MRSERVHPNRGYPVAVVIVQHGDEDPEVRTLKVLTYRVA